MVYQFDPSFKDCNFKKAPFLNGTTKAKDSLAQNGVFYPIYGYIWENAFVKFVNFGLFRPNEKMSARQVVYSKRPHDGEFWSPQNCWPTLTGRYLYLYSLT